MGGAGPARPTNFREAVIYQITLTGPAERANECAAALTSAGYFPQTDNGNITVEGEDINAPDAVARSYGWRLRMHTKVVVDAVVQTAAEYALAHSGYGVN